ncbi:MAG: LuxR C-terminal-related transcriptional regulator [Tannerellaceae bacterium]|nr:LuxR C-terminal-related transcriptional regulator [Tannerellaceae bacterium]
MNWLRKDQRESYLPDQDGIEQLQHPSTEEEYMVREIQLFIDLTVSKMSEKRKQIYTMSRVEGLKNEEIANQLNITKKTVEVQLNLALREIRKNLPALLFFFF